MAHCKTCDDNGVLCKCANPSRMWCDKRVCKGRTCPDCQGKSEPMVRCMTFEAATVLRTLREQEPLSTDSSIFPRE